MSTERGPRAEAPPELDAEQEVDFGRYWRTIAARWWLLLAGAVGGLLIGYLVALGTATSGYKATAQVYLGQQIAPSPGAVVISNVSTSLGLVSHFVTSESAVRKAAATSGLELGRLRGSISTKPILGVTTGRLGALAPLIAITVESSPPGNAERLLLLANINTTLSTGEGLLGQLEQDRQQTRQLLALAQEVERAHI